MDAENVSRARRAIFSNLAIGKPQGLFTIKNSSTGISNVAGRTAAVFALASWIWKKEKYDAVFADRLLTKASELYEMAKANLGALESVPCKTTDRYEEKTFFDDLEWAAVELYRATGKKEYLDEGLAFSEKAADESWMGADSTKFYECFPFVNLGHYELFGFADAETKKRHRDYYKVGLTRAFKKTQENVFNYGVPFVRGSNNLAVGLATQIILYKKMGGSEVFDNMLRDTRDYLFGINPWGKSFVIGVPNDGQYPKNPFSIIATNMNINLEGGLVNGPVRENIRSSESEINWKETDKFKQFQSDRCVYYDNSLDYVTNEPTLDGTASLMYVLAYYSRTEKYDSDGDGISDDDELLKYNTDPWKQDTDGDGIPDGVEIANGTNPIDPNDPKKEIVKKEPQQEKIKSAKAEPLKAEVGKAIVLNGIVFKSGCAVIEKDTSDMLGRALSTMNENKEIEVGLYGYTDNIGNEKKNVNLSKSRADAIKKWLTKNSIDEKRVKTFGLGSKNPIASNKTADGRAKNRRIEFVRVK